MNRTLTIIIAVALLLAVFAAIIAFAYFITPSGEVGLGDVFGLPSGASPPTLPE